MLFLCVYKNIGAEFIIVFVTILVETIKYCFRGRGWCEDHLVSITYCIALISVKVKKGCTVKAVKAFLYNQKVHQNFL